MTEHQLTQWLTEWVERATGAQSVDPTTPLETYGLSSRDAVILSGELENLLGRRVDPTIAYQYPTVAALAAALTGSREVRRELPEVRRQAEAHDIAIVGSAGRFPGAENNDAFWQLLIDGQGATGPLPAPRWHEYLGCLLYTSDAADE